MRGTLSQQQCRLCHYPRTLSNGPFARQARAVFLSAYLLPGAERGTMPLSRTTTLSLAHSCSAYVSFFVPPGQTAP